MGKGKFAGARFITPQMVFLIFRAAIPFSYVFISKDQEHLKYKMATRMRKPSDVITARQDFYGCRIVHTNTTARIRGPPIS